ncbi:hypothetical protein [Sphingomonas bacterium]|uniref:hypothetical protein n=1 Tax=Sphingomonas bacterium TaxID=1895847 RepID=UPI001576C38A|nr:hypothetical protein [Sphingomonas bacterium]
MERIHPAHLVLLLLAIAAAVGATPLQRHYTGAGGLVRLTYPAYLTPGHDFGGRSLMSSGWRLSWDGAAVGTGTGVVRFSQGARPTDGPGVVTELIQIGLSRDASVVAHCGTTGALGSGKRLPDRMLGGHRWTAYRNGDAGMSQAIVATDLRTVVDGVCYAIDRATYLVTAADDLPRYPPTQVIAAAQIDAVLASVRVGRGR